MRSVFIAAIAVVAMSVSQAAEKPAELKQGAGLDKVVAHCSACHSLDYIPMNSRFLDNAAWNAEVAKMINAFGAPIDPADAKGIARYLGINYGPQTASTGAIKVNRQPPAPSAPRKATAGVKPAEHRSLGGNKPETLMSDGKCWEIGEKMVGGWSTCR